MQVQPQPVYGYPNTQTPHAAESHSNGSFGAVFIVLAVIIVISGIACCLGRFCSKKKSHRHDKAKQPTKQKHKKGHSENDNNNIDIEFGFDKKIAAGKPAGLRGEPQPPGPPPPGRGFRMPGNGDFIRVEPNGLRGEPQQPGPPPPGRGFRMPAGNGDFRVEPKYPGGDLEFKPGSMHMRG